MLQAGGILCGLLAAKAAALGCGGGCMEAAGGYVDVVWGYRGDGLQGSRHGSQPMGRPLDLRV